jgi:cobalt-precorrin-5B (C1)-methyltransferase
MGKQYQKKKLKEGFTTGTCAAAAAKGALMLLLTKNVPSRVEIELLTGKRIFIPIHTAMFENSDAAVCSVIKDAGDDPDITHGAEIGARITRYDGHTTDKIMITGGQGVGTVTKPGLEVQPGEAAITSGPREMIIQAVTAILRQNNTNTSLRIEIFVPKGKILAQKTLNARLGIIGGISILGTTGVVRPMSNDAYIATIKASLSVARAAGLDRVVMTTGRRSERYAQTYWESIPEEGFVQIGDFLKVSLETASHNGFKYITLAVFFGKAVKMAQGFENTHAAKSPLTMEALARWSFEITKDSALAEKISSANTARHAFDFIYPKHPLIIAHVGKQILKSAIHFAGPHPDIQSVIFDYKGNVIFDSKDKRWVL